MSHKINNNQEVFFIFHVNLQNKQQIKANPILLEHKLASMQFITTRSKIKKN